MRVSTLRIRFAPILILGTVLLGLFAWVAVLQGLFGAWDHEPGLAARTAVPATVAAVEQRDPTEVIFWCIVLLAVAFVMGLAFWIIRKRLMAGDDGGDTGGLSLGFTLADLRQMHAEGQMTDEEFEYAKRKMAAKAKAQIEGSDPDAADEDRDAEPVIEDLGDISEPGYRDADASDPDPDKHDDSAGDFGDDPDKNDEP